MQPYNCKNTGIRSKYFLYMNAVLIFNLLVLKNLTFFLLEWKALSALQLG